MKRRGRPTKRTDEVCAEVIARLSKGEPLEQICRTEGMPHSSVIRDWMSADPDFSRDIARARDFGFDAIAHDAMAIADGKNRDNMVKVGRDRLRAEIRLKLLAKWCPKRYGEKVEVEHSGSVKAVIGGADA